LIGFLFVCLWHLASYLVAVLVKAVDKRLDHDENLLPLRHDTWFIYSINAYKNSNLELQTGSGTGVQPGHTPNALPLPDQVEVGHAAPLRVDERDATERARVQVLEYPQHLHATD